MLDMVLWMLVPLSVLWMLAALETPPDRRALCCAKRSLCAASLALDASALDIPPSVCVELEPSGLAVGGIRARVLTQWCS